LTYQRLLDLPEKELLKPSGSKRLYSLHNLEEVQIIELLRKFGIPTRTAALIKDDITTHPEKGTRTVWTIGPNLKVIGDDDDPVPVWITISTSALGFAQTELEKHCVKDKA
jgi:DNA-binding transcriptional MerR regulator